MSKKITVCACWDGSPCYTPGYVNRLYHSIKRNTSYLFDFVLNVGPFFTENDAKKVEKEIKIVQTNLPYWWCAMPFWQKHPKGVKTETLLYMDLDQVIIDNIDEIIDYPSDHCYMKDYPSDSCPKGKENDGNATVALIRNGAGEKVWEEYKRVGCPKWNPANPPSQRLFPLAAQGIVNSLNIPHDVFPENWVASYKLKVLQDGIPDGCKSISFHGHPKPHECLHQQFVVENWR